MSESASNAIAIDALSVRYGRRLAVDSVSTAVPTGRVFALLGRNGAGKSSLVRCLVGQQKPQSGRVQMLGGDVWRERVRLMERVGIVPEDADAPPDMKVSELIAFCSRLYSRWDANGIAERFRRFEIDATTRFGDLSKGQKKQVSLALALAMKPELLILDDPTLGLDAVARKVLFDEVITELADRGITVFVTTHDLAGVETIADRVAIMRAGRLVLDEDIETLKSRFRRIRYTNPPLLLANGGLQTAAVRSWGSGTEAVVSNFDDLAFERFRTTANVAEVSAMSLEEIFIAMTGEEVKA